MSSIGNSSHFEGDRNRAFAVAKASLDKKAPLVVRPPPEKPEKPKHPTKKLIKQSTVGRLLTPQSAEALRRESRVLKDVINSRVLAIPRPKKRPVRVILSDFALNTTCHGIAHIERGPSRWRRLFWTVVFILCLIMFCIQFFLMISRFLRFDKIVEIQIKFERVAFPTVTICNLNAYKQSEIRKIESAQRTLDVYSAVVSNINRQEQAQTGGARYRRQTPRDFPPPVGPNNYKDEDIPRYQPIRVLCDCDIELFCEPSKEDDESFEKGEKWRTMCVCFYDHWWRSFWPCYMGSQWHIRKCSNCTEDGSCNYEGRTVLDAPESDGIDCVCREASKFCLARPAKVYMELFRSLGLNVSEVPWEDISSLGTPPPSVIPKHLMEKLGYGDRKDKSAIQAKAKENLIFSVAELDTDTRIKMSYSKEEQIKQCSFAGRDCNIEKDFMLHLDPTYGNCYAFNGNVSSPMAASRPGALYGLRVLWFVNTSDYIPTTEASGVKIAVHHQTDYPFPDTFGYSAPTGFLSSFAVKKQMVDRLPYPYGDCLINSDFDAKEEKYLYGDAYSMEGCHRMCIQRNLISYCGCGDPRFLIPEGDAQSCRNNDIIGRKCLENVSVALTQLDSLHCRCRQPCTKTVFTVTFSTAQWPVEAARTSLCHSGEDCIKTYQEEAAFIEIYFEQVNYQQLVEHEAYGFVNLLADFGGNISLFLGVSVITFIEFAVLIYELFTSGVWGSQRLKELEEEEQPVYIMQVNPDSDLKRQFPPGWPTDHVDMNVTMTLESESDNDDDDDDDHENQEEEEEEDAEMPPVRPILKLTVKEEDENDEMEENVENEEKEALSSL